MAVKPTQSQLRYAGFFKNVRGVILVLDFQWHKHRQLSSALCYVRQNVT